MFNLPDKVETVIEWLNAEQAQSLLDIAKEAGLTTQRLAQGRGILGRIKVRLISSRSPGWADNSRRMQSFLRGPFKEWKARVNYFKP